MDCPYKCGWKGTPEEYSKHYETCPKRPRTPGKHSSPEVKVRNVEFKNGKWEFDSAMQDADWNPETFDLLVAETAKTLDAAEKSEFWRQYNEWVRLAGYHHSSPETPGQMKRWKVYYSVRRAGGVVTDYTVVEAATEPEANSQWEKGAVPRGDYTYLYTVPESEKEMQSQLLRVISVKEEQIPTFTPAFLNEIGRAWKGRKTMSYWDWLIEPTDLGVNVTLRGTNKPHEFFSGEIIEKMRYDPARRVYHT
jgi:hypothetical protein